MLISIIVPIYNSANFMDKLLHAIEAERLKNRWQLELILIDDGSKDNSYNQIEKLSKQYSYIRGIKLSRNFGHQAAVRTGLDYVHGDYVAIIDDDLQDPPSLLPQFFAKLDQGYEVVYGVRRKRKENFLKVFSYATFYRLLKSISDTDIPLDTGDFCVMKKVVVEKMLSLPEKNPFLRGIRAWVGFKQLGLEYERSERIEGESGYTLKKLLKIASDGIFSFSNLPLKLISVIGSTGLGISLIYTIYILTKYFTHGIEQPGFVTIIVFIMFFGSLNLICLGIIGEYIARIYTESKNRPHSIIEKTLNL
ncbi:MAG: glycosyltransferase family 2 protein [Bacteriovoracaceae bacterium]